jgi:thioredoxin 1
VTPTPVVSPLEKALASGVPTLAEFGRGTCIPCKEMKPILDELALLYKDKLNVVIVSVDDYQRLTSHYGIMAIPTQIFFNSSGTETFRHIGFYPKNNIIIKLKQMGIE